MVKTYLKAGRLIGYGLRTRDAQRAAVRDLVVDPTSWSVRYLTAETDAWAPGREVPVPPRSLTGVDEGRREIETELTFDQLREGPSLAASAPITRDFEENYYRYHGWAELWRAEIDAESAGETPLPVAPPAEQPLPSEGNADAPGLVRYEQLRTWPGSMSDACPVWLQELLIDDVDWTVAYLEVLIDDLPIRERCLISSSLVIAADPRTERVHLAATGDGLRQAPLRPYPAPDEQGCEVRVLESTGS